MTSMATAGMRADGCCQAANEGAPAPMKTATVTGTENPMRTRDGTPRAAKMGATMKRLVQRTSTRKKPMASGCIAVSMAC